MCIRDSHQFDPRQRGRFGRAQTDDGGERLATMEDVARAAKVSMSTVSHVLNGTRKVSPATVAAVRDAIRKTGYVPNTLAQALAGAASRTIGVAISALTNHYFSGVVRAIEAECARRGLMMFLADTHDDPAQELRVIQALHQRRVDGIILAPAAGSERQVVDYLDTVSYTHLTLPTNGW